MYGVTKYIVLSCLYRISLDTSALINILNTFSAWEHFAPNVHSLWTQNQDLLKFYVVCSSIVKSGA